jgi:hypothetical protein
MESIAVRIIYLLLLLASMIGNVLAKDVPIVAKVDRVYLEFRRDSELTQHCD